MPGLPAQPRIALASRELHPFGPGGIALVTTGLARTLGEDAAVTVFTSDRHREGYEAIAAAEPLGAGVEVVFAPDPEPTDAAYYQHSHQWSAALLAAIRAHYGARGPDLIEFGDYLAEGFVTLQARRTADPFLAATTIAVRLHTSAELASVLNGSLATDFATRSILEAERYCLRHADRLLYCGGDVLGSYTRYYGAGLAPGACVPDVIPLAGEPAPPPAGGPLRMLFVGRLERRKGVQNLIRAAVRSGSDSWRLTLVGGDTTTAPLGVSMRGQLELMAAGDERIEFRRELPRDELGAVIGAHDLVVAPSAWECWPSVVRESLFHNRPVLATPVGGHVEMVEPGVSGWLTRDTSVAAIGEELDRLAAAPALVRDAIASGGPRRVAARLDDPARTRAGYAELIASGPRVPARPAPRRRGVSVLVPYYRMHRHVTATLDSIARQTRRPDEIVVVNDGSFERDDALLERLADEHGLRIVTQPNDGLSSARNFGLAHLRGDYVLPLDPDNEIEPEFIERCLWALEHDAALAYATTWSVYVDEAGEPLAGDTGFSPYGNWSDLIAVGNVGGDSAALFRRELFEAGFRYHPDLASYEDWFLYRELHAAGHHGDVIPLRLLRYRVRADSLLRTVGKRYEGELEAAMNALMIGRSTRWMPEQA